MRSWRFRAATLLASFGLCGLAAEASLWAMAPLSSDEWLAWEPDGHVKGLPTPDQTLRTGAGYEIRINRLGLRGHDPAWEPAPGTLRVAVFGGSSTFGLNARSDEATWPAQLEARLREQLDLPVEVINLGLPGYDLSNSKIHYLFSGRSLHPHIAVAYHTWNDLKSLRPRARSPIVRARVVRTRPLWARLARHTQLARRLARLQRTRSEAEIENHYALAGPSRAEADAPPPEESWEWARRNFVDFCRFTQADGVLPVLVTQATTAVPHRIDDPRFRRAIREHLVEMTLPRLAETWQQMNELIRDVAREEGALFADGYSALPHDFEHLSDHVHLTDRGRQALAAHVAEAMVADRRFQVLAQRVRDDGAARIASAGNAANGRVE